MAETSFDLLVIGAGPGGYVAAIRGAQLGMKVGCVEKEALGGTCLNVGCIPSKALLESSELYEQARTKFKKHGIQTGELGLDLGAMMKRKNTVVQRMNRGIGGLFKKHKISHIEGTARIAGPGKVEVDSAGEKQTLTASHILIATGSRPAELPNLPFDGKVVLSSKEALELEEAPGRLLVIGAGAIGLELGSVWNRLGSEVLVAELLDHIVPGMDREMGDGLRKLLNKQGIKIRLETSAESFEMKEGKAHVRLKSGSETSEEVCDRVLVAVGRKPNTEGLGAKDAGIHLDDRGRIVVNRKFETSLSGVFAVGDVIAGPMLAHKAEEEGVAAVEMMAGLAGHVNYDTIPGVVYTYPELASVGLSEEAAAEKGLKVRIGRFPLMANGRAHSLEAPEGQVKVISEEKTDRILGVHILAARASEMIAEAVVAMEFSASSEDLARTVHAHPTLPEALKEAALAVDGRAIHI